MGRRAFRDAGYTPKTRDFAHSRLERLGQLQVATLALPWDPLHQRRSPCAARWREAQTPRTRRPNYQGWPIKRGRLHKSHATAPIELLGRLFACAGLSVPLFGSCRSGIPSAYRGGASGTFFQTSPLKACALATGTWIDSASRSKRQRRSSSVSAHLTDSAKFSRLGNACPVLRRIRPLHVARRVSTR